MAFVHSKDTRVLVGEDSFSCVLNSLDHSTEREMADVTAFCDDGHKFIPGLDSGTLSIGGIWDKDASVGAPDDVLETARGASSGSIITIGPAGFTAGNRIISLEARESSYAITSEVTEAVAFTAEWTSEGPIDFGVSLHDLESEDAEDEESEVDNSASSSNGGIAVLHVTENDHDGNTVIKIQHSSDTSTWADLVTFTTVGSSTTTSERKTVSGTVNRYLRAAWSPGGSSGSVTFMVGFCRR